MEFEYLQKKIKLYFVQIVNLIFIFVCFNNLICVTLNKEALHEEVLRCVEDLVSI